MEKHSDRKAGTRVNAQVMQIKVCSNHDSGRRVGPHKNRENSSHNTEITQKGLDIEHKYMLIKTEDFFFTF